MNLAQVCCLLDSQSILQTDRQRLFHHDMDAVPGADFDHAAMVVSIGVDEDGLRMCSCEHLFQVGEQ